MLEIVTMLTAWEIVLTTSGDNIYASMVPGGDPLILLMARGPLLRASVKASVSFFSLSFSSLNRIRIAQTLLKLSVVTIDTLCSLIPVISNLL